MSAKLFAVADLAAVTSYPTDPQVEITEFTPTSVSVVNEHASAPVYVSFDGSTDAGLLTPGKPSAGMQWGGGAGQMKLWFKRAAGTYTGAITCSVMAEG